MPERRARWPIKVHLAVRSGAVGAPMAELGCAGTARVKRRRGGCAARAAEQLGQQESCLRAAADAAWSTGWGWLSGWARMGTARGMAPLGVR